MVICVLMASHQAAEIMRNIIMLIHRIWKTLIHGGLKDSEGAGHPTVPKRTSLT